MNERNGIDMDALWARINETEASESMVKAMQEAELVAAVASGTVDESTLSDDERALVERSARLRGIIEAEIAGQGDADVDFDSGGGGGDVPSPIPFPRWIAAAAGFAVVAVIGGALYFGGGSSGPADDGDQVAIEQPVDWGDLIGGEGPASGSLARVDALSSDAFDWETFGVVEERRARRSGTMGASGAERSVWRTAAVIVRLPDGHGSGVFISDDGWILTNFHVVESVWQEAVLTGKAASVAIIRAQMNGRLLERIPGETAATVYRVDPSRDLALLRLDEVPDDLYHVELGDPMDVGECWKVGSPGGDAAWNFQRGDVTNRYRFPAQLTDRVVRSTGDSDDDESAPVTGRVQAMVLRTDISTAPGDSGGPLLDTDGRLIGLTFATPSTLSTGAVGLHIGISEIRAFLGDDPAPDAPELGPFDMWAAGVPSARIASSQVVDAGDRGSAPVAAFRPFRPRPGNDPAGGGERVADAVFVGEPSDTVTPDESTVLFPSGMWGVGDSVGNLPYRFAVVRTVTGITVCEYRSADGFAEQRIDRNGDGRADLTYVRDAGGPWRLVETGQPVIDLSRVPESAHGFIQRLEGVGERGRAPGVGGGRPPRGGDGIGGRGRGLNKMGDQDE